MTPGGFEPTISACERPQTHALDRTSTGTGVHLVGVIKKKMYADIKNARNGKI